MVLVASKDCRRDGETAYESGSRRNAQERATDCPD